MIKRKERIIISAIELLAEEGINGVTTKNLADKEKVTEPALYRQFKGKQEIIESMLREFAGYDERIEATIQQSDLTGKEAIMFYVERYAELYQNYSELTTIMLSLDMYFYGEETKRFMKELTARRIAFLENIICKDQGIFALTDRFMPREIASIIYGVIFSQIFEWRMNDMEYPLDERLKNMISKLL